MEVVDGLSAFDVEPGVAGVAADLLLAFPGELLGGFLLDVVLVGHPLGNFDAEVVVAEGAYVEMRLAVRQDIAAAGPLEDIRPEVGEVLGSPVSEELGESADPGDLGWFLLLREVERGLPGAFRRGVDRLQPDLVELAFQGGDIAVRNGEDIQLHAGEPRTLSLNHGARGQRLQIAVSGLSAERAGQH